MGVCNVFQLFCVSLPEVKQYTDSEIENMYNDLQTGNTIQFETKIGTLSASVMAPGNFSIRIQGHVSFAIPNRFENFYDYIKNIQHDRNINIIRLLVPINTGNRLHREPKQTITI